MARKKKHKTRPFRSKAQWRFFYANPRLRKYAKKKAHATQRAGGGPKVAYRRLPRRRGIKKHVG